MPGIVVEIIGNASQFKRELNSAVAATNKANSGLARLSKAAGIAGLALAGGLAIGAKVGFDELREGQNVSAQTASALKSTGQAANVTQKHIESLATSLSQMSGVDDEVIQASENMLLAFTNVRNEVGQGNDVFDRATKVILDYSARTGKDAAGAAKLFGKALQDPVRYSSALARAGITLSDAQKKQIKAFTDAGKPMEAQKLLLAALEQRYGGAAKAAGETLTGQLNIASNSFREMAANLITLLLPAITAFSRGLASAAKFLQEHEAIAKVLGITLAALAATLLTISVAAKTWAAIQAVVTAATWAWNAALAANPIGLVVVAIAALVAGLILAWQHSERFRAIVTAAFDAVKGAANAVLSFFRDNWRSIVTLISGPFIPLVALATNAFGVRTALINAANAVLDFFRSNWKTIAVLVSGPFAPLVALATNAFGVRSALIGAFEAVKSSVVGVLSAIQTKFTWFATTGVRLWERISGALQGPLAVIARAFQAVLDVLNAIIGAIEGVIDKVGSLLGALKSIPGVGLLGKIPGLQTGGIVSAGSAYIVGEAGPEVFVPSISGTIIPNSSPGAMPSFRGAGGGTSVNVYVSGSVVSERDLENSIVEALIRRGRRNGGNILGGYA